MHDRLAKLCFLPPPLGTPWSDPPAESAARVVMRLDETPVPIELPLFWFDPPWHRLSAPIADLVAVAVAELGVIVSAMRSDLGGDQSGAEHVPVLHRRVEVDEQSESDEGTPKPAASYLPRMVPYRPERYGLSGLDFDQALAIDVRLTPARDTSGRLGYSPQRIQRWEAAPSDQPVAGGGWVPAAAFPPDVASVPELSRKIAQLHALSPAAAVFASIGGQRLKEELPAVLGTRPDGVILRFEEMQLDGLQLAQLTQLARQMTLQHGLESFPLWIVPGPVTADDAAKLIELGASAIAIDGWGETIIDEAERFESERHSSTTLRRSDQTAVYRMIDECLLPQIERFTGLWMSMRSVPANQRLACLSTRWSKTLNLPTLSVPGVLAEDG